jgi:hypothetical protein
MARVRFIEVAGIVSLAASLAACSGTSSGGQQAISAITTTTATVATSASPTTPSPSETVAISSTAAPTTTLAPTTSALTAAESTQILANVRKLYSAALDDSMAHGGQSTFSPTGLGIKDVTAVIAGSAAVDAIWGPATSSSVRPLMCGSNFGTNGAVVGAPVMNGNVIQVPVEIRYATRANASATVVVDPASEKITGVTCPTTDVKLAGDAGVAGYWGTLVGSDPNADKSNYFTAGYRAQWPSGTTYIGPAWTCSQNGTPWWVATQDGSATTSVKYVVVIWGHNATDTVDVALNQIADVSCK